MRLTREVTELINGLTREQAKALLENVSAQVHDAEGVNLLRKAVRENVIDGTISVSALREASEAND